MFSVIFPDNLHLSAWVYDQYSNVSSVKHKQIFRQTLLLINLLGLCQKKIINDYFNKYLSSLSWGFSLIDCALHPPPIICFRKSLLFKYFSNSFLYTFKNYASVNTNNYCMIYYCIHLSIYRNTEIVRILI